MLCIVVRAYRGQIERGLSLLVLHGRVGAMSQKQGTQLCAALLCRLMQRGEGPLICGVHTGVVLDEQGSDVHVLREAQDENTAINMRASNEVYFSY